MKKQMLFLLGLLLPLLAVGQQPLQLTEDLYEEAAGQNTVIAEEAYVYGMVRWNFGRGKDRGYNIVIHSNIPGIHYVLSDDNGQAIRFERYSNVMALSVMSIFGWEYIGSHGDSDDSEDEILVRKKVRNLRTLEKEYYEAILSNAYISLKE